MPVLYIIFFSRGSPTPLPPFPCPRPRRPRSLGDFQQHLGRGSLGGFELPNEDSCDFSGNGNRDGWQFQPKKCVKCVKVNLKPPKLDVLDINPACLLLMYIPHIYLLGKGI